MNATLSLLGVTLLVALVATRLAEVVGRRLGLVDHPEGHLKIHDRPVPRSGGMAILLALFAAQGWSAYQDATLFTSAELITLTLLFALGAWDDFRPRSPKLRLLLQVLIFAVSWFLGVQMEVFGSLALDFAFALICFIVVVNAVNFYDGMDGVLALTSIAALGVWSVASADAGAVWAPFAVTAVAALGFLPRNWQPARIFLGDGGSFILGFIFYLVFVRSGPETAGIVPGFWIAAVPVCDAVAATFDRMIQKRGVWTGDRDHIYDIMGRWGFSARRVAFVLAIAAALMARAVVAPLESTMTVGLTMTAALYGILVTAVLLLRRRFRQRAA
jgi:UDP-GlcNAc:undecaprenyl-phosphate GlcNAc-1-phosphate transferase